MRTKLALVIMLAVVPAQAYATPYLISLTDPSGITGIISAPGTLANNLNVYIGASWITGDLGNLEAYCVDLNSYSGGNTTDVSAMSNWNLGTGFGLGGHPAAWLYEHFATTLGGVNSANERAALQLAIWNSLYDTDANVLALGGAGQGFAVRNMPAIITSRADEMLSLALAADYSGANAWWLQMPNAGQAPALQDYITQPVPELGSGLLLFTGLSGLAVRLRSKKNRSSRPRSGNLEHRAC
jgi:hypothetical protein